MITVRVGLGLTEATWVRWRAGATMVGHIVGESQAIKVTIRIRPRNPSETEGSWAVSDTPEGQRQLAHEVRAAHHQPIPGVPCPVASTQNFPPRASLLLRCRRRRMVLQPVSSHSSALSGTSTFAPGAVGRGQVAPTAATVPGASLSLSSSSSSSPVTL
jgi:hypothetical protein